MKQWTVLVVLLGCVFFSFSQSYRESYRVVDGANGHPISGVWVYCSAENYSISDSAGWVTLENCSDTAVVWFSHPAYDSLSTPIAKDKMGLQVVVLYPKAITTPEMLVSAYLESREKKSSISIAPLRLDEIEKLGSFSLTEALTVLPGVNQLGTGIGISKPVIRGLYGNRLLVLFSGMRFDNQQWQEEHGLGLSDVGISRVEVIKGPLSVLYGTEAIGGVINILEENPVDSGTTLLELASQFHTNTLGGTWQAGIKSNNGSRWWRLRGAYTSHSDYSDGRGARVLNSRFDGIYGKASLGWKRGRWISDNHYHFSVNHFGFIFNDLEKYMPRDDRWSRQMLGPHHIVMLHLYSSLNTLQLSRSTLRLNFGFQSNFRKEDEGGGELSLKMHLFTAQTSVKWQRPIGKSAQLVWAQMASLERNTNFGKRKIVPDATMAEGANSLYFMHHLQKWTIEYGAGVGLRYIETYPTKGVNVGDKELTPFSASKYFGNALLGIRYQFTRFLSSQFLLSTGVRSPNLAELSADGLHEGIYLYEIGNPLLKNEQNRSVELGLSWQEYSCSWDLSAFIYAYKNYIYLNPTDEKWYGFSVYRFEQRDAFIRGGELSQEFGPTWGRGLVFKNTFSALIGEQVDGSYLPYMPAQQLKSRLSFQKTKRHSDKWEVYTEVQNILRQNKLAQNELGTPHYVLWDVGLGSTWNTKRSTVSANLIGKNLGNAAYYDHLSRLKNFGTLNIGRNIVLQLKIQFKQLKNNKNDQND